VHPDLQVVLDAIIKSDDGFVNFFEALDAVNLVQVEEELQDIVDEAADEADSYGD